MRWMDVVLPLLLLGNACHGPKETPAPPTFAIGEGAQRTLLPADPYKEARQALQDRQITRERRFRDAYSKGSLWRWLRVEQADIEWGKVQGAQLVEIGRELFVTDFTREQGLGNGLAEIGSKLAGNRKAPNLRHVHYKEFGGPDATRCLSCHHIGGEGGSGFLADNVFLDGDGETPKSGLSRNPRSLAGAALIQLLAEEMSQELAQKAKEVGSGKEAPLSAKGVSFGTFRRKTDGTVDATALSGVGPDLRVRPFGWKGDVATLREAVEAALAKNLGVQPERYLNDPQIRQDPNLVGDGKRREDPDHDGVTREATEGMVTALSVYLASIGPPIEEMPEDPSFLHKASLGAELFEQVGCASCHVPELPLVGTVIGLGPGKNAAPRVDLSPLLSAPVRTGRMAGVRIYSDLKRHDMGDSLAEPRDYHGVSKRQWLTPPLWGIAASGPYLHDGRAATLDGAILAHDGEAKTVRDAYRKLSFAEQGALHLFLMVLDRPHHLEFRR